MKKVVIVLSAIISAALMFCAIGIKSDACNKTPGCMTTQHNVVCGYRHGEYLYTHQVYYPNMSENCIATRELAGHNVYCTGCGALLIENETRQCNELHNNSHCTLTRYNLCVY